MKKGNKWICDVCGSEIGFWDEYAENAEKECRVCGQHNFRVTVRWFGETECDFCEKLRQDPDLKKHEWFVDGKTKFGPWALMCPKHFKQYGVGLGTGKGQKYDSKTLEKIEG